MTEHVAWLGTTPLAALITVAIFLAVLALAVVLCIALLGGQNRR